MTAVSRLFLRAAVAALASAMISCASAPVETGGEGPVAHPEKWPEVAPPFAHDPALEARIDALMARMSLEDKVGQIIQADSSAIEPEDLKTYKLGSVLSGGNSAPKGQAYAAAEEWLELLDAYYEAAMEGPEGAVRIPPLFGIDAVHGHNNVVGGTIFPHNIGLGATRNPALARRIAEATAVELSVTGHDWTFAPTVAVPRDDRWGRAYEGFSEAPEVVASYSGGIVEGLQGAPGTDEFFSPGRVVSSAKHFLGDGGTKDGVDQGDNLSTEEELRDIHAAGYPAAVEAGVQTVMASFNSWHGKKMHGRRGLLTGVLKERWGFDGFIVGDWNGHGQVEGCTNESCPASFNAGLDMFMAPDSWRGLYHNTLEQVRSGEIPMERLDDAVRRILRVKLRAGLFDKPKPSARPLAGRTELLGAPAHRALARQAVRESLVLLKNNGGVLPLQPGRRVLVAGDGADSISMQSGGWTLTWQGTGVDNDAFPNGETIFAGIRAAVESAGGAVEHAPDGEYTQRPDVAIFVIGEEPYAEGYGDRPTVDFDRRDPALLAAMRRLRADGVPVVTVFLSGRPLWANPELNASDAFVAAWLPGTEGGGIADVLFRDEAGGVRYDFTGKLPFSWPAEPTQTPLNVGDEPYEPLFAFGYGLTYADRTELPELPEESVAAQAGASTFFARGAPATGMRLVIGEAGGKEAEAAAPSAQTPGGGLSLAAFDRAAQEDARAARWNGEGAAYVMIATDAPLDLANAVEAGLALTIDARVSRAPAAPARLAMACGEGCEGGVDVADTLAAMEGAGWGRLSVSLQCFVADGLDPARVTAPFRLETAGALGFDFSAIALAPAEAGTMTCR
ncbi:glycoside hydrolase family 3 protein [Amphiplicatus metriothermophilus]|uniref:Exo-1,4-beta-glucosidase n=1 Tax=Amphiplicatus metriothermophilus TaxID=1519374 RepID=A0A239PY57_9PROT|nr:glycoside hydrolase family 3 protein [Amphiplicatus metriothermophilus]MBB5519993.1 beta-glucosidase [Amphiplicatus metriothermophilus]SNT74892.1 exo-1,4-beta-glucosidase [Amphiplicatus metriothermophilus]